MQRIIKFHEFPINEEKSNSLLDKLKKKYPNSVMTLSPEEKFPGMFFAKLEIIRQDGEKEYIGAIKGPVSRQDALEFFERGLRKNYDKFY
jgi:hypothetical protein